MRSKMDAVVRAKDELRKAEEEVEELGIEIVAAAAECAAANNAQSKLSAEKAEASSGKAARRAQSLHAPPHFELVSSVSDFFRSLEEFKQGGLVDVVLDK